jgi:hypothetical protein
MSIRNPAHRGQQTPAPRGGATALSPREWEMLRVAVAAVLAALPQDQPMVTLHEIAVAVRTTEAAVAPDAFDGDTISAVLRELGHEVRA